MIAGRVRPALVIGCCLAVVVAGLATWVVLRGDCRVQDETVAAADVRPPFDKTTQDDRTTRLAASATTWDLGDVIGSLGFDYDRHLQLAPLPGHLGVWTKREPVFAVLGPDLAPDWGLREQSVRRTYDAGPTRFITVTAAKDAAAEVSAYRLKDGRRQWCHQLDQDSLGARDPISTLTTDKATFVLAGKVGDQRLTRLDQHGDQEFAIALDADRGDALIGPWDGVLVAGGRPQYELSEPATKGDQVVGLDERTGKKRWAHEVADGATTSVVGALDGQVVLLEQDPGSGQRLVALGADDGARLWEAAVPTGASPDFAVRGDVVLSRTATALTAYDVGTGKRRWRQPIPQQPQYFPYGFRLAEQPMLDSNTVLLAGTSALHQVDLTTGRSTDLALPIDGINTTWWPYQLTVGDGLIAVVTNSGAIVLREES